MFATTMGVILAATMAADGGTSAFGGVGVGPGFSLNGEPVSFQASVRGGMAFALPLERLSVAVYLPLRMMVAGEERGATRSSVFGIALVPTGRARFEIVPRLRAYFDFGVGWSHVGGSVDSQFFGTVQTSLHTAEFDTAFGVEYAPHDNVALFFEPMSLRIFTGGRGTARTGNFIAEFDQPGAAVWALLLGAHVTFAL